MRDLRLYTYDSGSLRKYGRGKTGVHRHFYNSMEDIEAYVDRLGKAMSIVKFPE